MVEDKDIELAIKLTSTVGYDEEELWEKAVKQNAELLKKHRESLTKQLELAKKVLGDTRERLVAQEGTLNLNLNYALYKLNEGIAEINNMEKV